MAGAAAVFPEIRKGRLDVRLVAALHRHKQRFRLAGRSLANREKVFPIAPNLGFRGVLAVVSRGGSKNFGQRTYLNSMTFGSNQAVLNVSEGGIKSPVPRRNARFRPAKQVIEGPIFGLF